MSLLVCGCETYPNWDSEQKELRAQLATVVVEDGINSLEADIIARSYFHRFGLCGVADKVTDGGEFWISNTYIGIAPVPTREPIRIDKRTGRVTWSYGPTIENPKTIL